MRVTFILNGSKKKAHKIAAEIAELNGKKLSLQFYYTQVSGDAARLSEQHCVTSDVIVPVGGDGTIHECVHGLARWKDENPTGKLPAIAPFPLGSGNDFIRNFTFDFSPQGLLDRIHKNQKTTIDVGRIDHDNGVFEYFINALSLGLGPAVVERTNKMPTSWSGHFKFGWAILRTFPLYKKKLVDIRNEKFEWSGKAMLVAISNGKYLGSGIGIAPEASLSDGLFNITIIGNVSIFDYLRYLPDLKKGIRIAHPEIHYYTARKIKIKTKGRIESDGELGSEANGTVQICEHKLEIL